MHHAATAITAPDTDHLPAYWQFHDAVARAQLMAWLPRRRHMIVDVSGPRGPGAELAALAGHRVLRVIDASLTASQRRAGAAQTDERGTSEQGRRRLPREPKGAAPTGLPREPKDAAPTGLPREPKDAAPTRLPREPKGAAPTGLTSDEGARREGDASKAARRRGSIKLCRGTGRSWCRP